MQTAHAISLFLQSLEGGVLSPATVDWYRLRLSPLAAVLGRRQVGRITLDELRAWRVKLAGQARSPWTLHGYVRAARRFFAWLVEEGHLQASPAARLELPRLPAEPAKAISRSDMRRIIRAALGSPRDYALCLFLADTGCRVGGVAGLTVEALDLRTGRALVIEKGSRSRVVYMTPRTCEAIRAYLDGRRSGPVWLGKRGPLTTWGIRQAIERLAQRAGAEGRCNPHAWRHGAARGWLSNGANLAQVAQMLGHSDVSVTVRFYGTFVDSELKAAHSRYSVLREDD